MGDFVPIGLLVRLTNSDYYSIRKFIKEKKIKTYNIKNKIYVNTDTFCNALKYDKVCDYRIN